MSYLAQIRRRIGGVLLALIASVGVVALAPGAALAVNADSFITSASVRETQVVSGGQLILDFAFQVPQGAVAGDSYTLSIPPEMYFPDNSPLEITDATGAVVAVATPNGQDLTFVLQDYVNAHTGISGTGFLPTRIVSGSQNPVTIPLQFVSGSDTFDDSVLVTPSAPTNVDLVFVKGYWNDPADRGVANPRDAVLWRADAPVGPWDTMDVTLTPEPDTSLTCSSIKFYQTFDPPNGTPAPLSAFTEISSDGFEVSCVEDKVTVRMTKPAPAGVMYSFRLDASVVDQRELEFWAQADGIDPSNPARTSQWRNLIDRPTSGGGGGGDPLVPALSVVKYSTADGPIDGRYPAEPGKPLTSNVQESITIAVTNTGSDAIRSLAVTDETTAGPELQIDCEVDGTLLPGETVTCEGTLPGLPGPGLAADTVTASGVGTTSGTEVNATDSWFGTVSNIPTTTPVTPTPNATVPDPVAPKGSLASTGATPLPAIWASIVLLVVGAAAAGVARSRRRLQQNMHE